MEMYFWVSLSETMFIKKKLNETKKLHIVFQTDILSHSFMLMAVLSSKDVY